MRNASRLRPRSPITPVIDRLQNDIATLRARGKTWPEIADVFREQLRGAAPERVRLEWHACIRYNATKKSRKKARAHRSPSPKGWHKTKAPLPSPGLYAIYQNGFIVYVGSSSDLARRLSPTHTQLARIEPAHCWLKVRYCKPGSYEWLAAEARLIARLKPCWNKRHNQERVVILDEHEMRLER